MIDTIAVEYSFMYQGPPGRCFINLVWHVRGKIKESNALEYIQLLIFASINNRGILRGLEQELIGQGIATMSLHLTISCSNVKIWMKNALLYSLR